ncbi:MAG: 30S ribosomal protein S8 [Desulfatirhabdiaceae bacterium]|jgi:small subunit ribosomal protein S8
MAISDPIADMMTRIRNAFKAKFSSVDIPGSSLKLEIARVMKAEGYIRNYKFIKDNKQGVLRVYLKYGLNHSSAIMGIERISKPSRRVYNKGKEIKPVLNGLGISILTTSKGILSDKQAKIENIGGELLCKIW